MIYTTLTSKPLTQPVRNLSGWRRKVSVRVATGICLQCCLVVVCVSSTRHIGFLSTHHLDAAAAQLQRKTGFVINYTFMCIFSFSVPDGLTVLTYNRMIRPENKLSTVDILRYCDRNTEPSPREIASPLIAPTFHTHVCDRSTNDFPRSKGKSFFLTARR
jgi:hypothetical protein